MHGKIKRIKHGKIIQGKVKNEVYKSEFWTSIHKSSNYNTCKIKQNNNKKSISIAIETAKCLALNHISTKNGKKKKHKLRSTALA
jgi:hypothetical protein